MEKPIKVIIALFILAAIGLMGYYWGNQWHTRKLEAAREEEKKIHQLKMAQLEAEIQKLKKETEFQTEKPPDKSEIIGVFGSEKPFGEDPAKTEDCSRIDAQRVSFFQYLDSREYFKRVGKTTDAETLFRDVYQKLAANPPVNVGELENLQTLIHNVTHFYRILGKDRVFLIKEIFQKESAILEPAMAVMFAWITTCDTGNINPPQSEKLDSLYPYACFFLNTLGGRGYLLRRDSKTRMLTNFYSLMIIDMANDAQLNALGIDIRPHIDYVFYDINNQKGLMYRQRYLAHLVAMKNKYQ